MQSTTVCVLGCSIEGVGGCIVGCLAAVGATSAIAGLWCIPTATVGTTGSAIVTAK